MSALTDAITSSTPTGVSYSEGHATQPAPPPDRPPPVQDKPKGRSVVEILSEVQAGTLDPTAAIREILGMGLGISQDQAIISVNNAFEQGKAVRAKAVKSVVKTEPVKTTTTKDTVPLVGAGQDRKGGETTLAGMQDIFRLPTQRAPEAGFRQFAGARQRPLSELTTNYFARPFARAFPLSAFFRGFSGGGEQSGLDQLRQFTPSQFLGGNPDADFLSSVPNPFQIRQALGAAGRGGVGDAQQATSRAFLDPGANQDVFRTVLDPMMSQSGDLFGPMIQDYLQAAFDRFQEEDPSRSFLTALINRTAGQPFANMPGF